ncbi:MAG: thioredoxin family protein [Roseivivax sp.]|nr:thioredoxin family protein [Roseivivax sp.]
MSLRNLLTAATAGWFALAGAALADPILVMVEQAGCAYCAMWNEKIAPIYPKTPEGKFAPLVRADLRADPPEGVTYARRVNYTPTFILVDDGKELARIEGYPGEDFFWGLLGMMLEAHTEFRKEAS